MSKARSIDDFSVKRSKSVSASSINKDKTDRELNFKRAKHEDRERHISGRRSSSSYSSSHYHNQKVSKDVSKDHKDNPKNDHRYHHKRNDKYEKSQRYGMKNEEKTEEKTEEKWTHWDKEHKQDSIPKRLSSQLKMRILIPTVRIGAMIGQQGANTSAIRKKYGVSVWVVDGMKQTDKHVPKKDGYESKVSKTLLIVNILSIDTQENLLLYFYWLLLLLSLFIADC